MASGCAAAPRDGGANEEPKRSNSVSPASARHMIRQRSLRKMLRRLGLSRCGAAMEKGHDGDLNLRIACTLHTDFSLDVLAVFPTPYGTNDCPANFTITIL